LQFEVSGVRRKPDSGVGESPSWLRHRILIPTCEGSNPSSPAKNFDFAFFDTENSGIALIPGALFRDKARRG
jgi:hypothetical protein